jgi:hypothetical protein
MAPLEVMLSGAAPVARVMPPMIVPASVKVPVSTSVPELVRVKLDANVLSPASTQ